MLFDGLRARLTTGRTPALSSSSCSKSLSEGEEGSKSGSRGPFHGAADGPGVLWRMFGRPRGRAFADGERGVGGYGAGRSHLAGGGVLMLIRL